MKTKNNRWHLNQAWAHHQSILVAFFLLVSLGLQAADGKKPREYPTLFKTVEVEGINIFYREAGDRNKPTLLLLHGYPTSSHMFRNLISDLSDRYHLLAPDYPGYGRSDQPAMSEFDYTFDHLAEIVDGFLDALSIERFSIYLMDYGAPVGYRIALKHPEKVQALIVQNGNAYQEGLTDF